MAFTPAAVEDEEAVEIKAEAAKGPMLIIAKGASTGETFPIKTKELSLGRDPASDIFLNDVTVSRRHAKLVRERDEIFLVDVGSLNGTYVNNARADRVTLNSGDELQIGKFKLIFIDREGQKGSDHGS